MEIGIISDSHDRLDNLTKVMHLFEKQGIKTLIHCGDFCAPFMIKELAKFNGKVHCVFGNIDDRYSSTKFAIQLGVELHGDMAEVEIDKKKIAITHFPWFANGLAFTGKYDIVFHGHDHTAKQQKIKNTLLVNPGELAGIRNPPSYAIYDTETDSVELKHLE